MIDFTVFYKRADYGPIVLPRDDSHLRTFLFEIESDLKELVATACSTGGNVFATEPVEVRFVELQHSPGSSPVRFELAISPTEALKRKLGAARPTDVILELRSALVIALESHWLPKEMTEEIKNGFYLLKDLSNPILRVRWIDPDDLLV